MLTHTQEVMERKFRAIGDQARIQARMTIGRQEEMLILIQENADPETFIKSEYLSGDNMSTFWNFRRIILAPFALLGMITKGSYALK